MQKKQSVTDRPTDTVTYRSRARDKNSKHSVTKFDPTLTRLQMNGEGAFSHGAFEFAKAIRGKWLGIVVVGVTEKTSEDVALMRFFLVGDGMVGIHVFPRFRRVAQSRGVVAALPIDSDKKKRWHGWIQSFEELRRWRSILVRVTHLNSVRLT